MMLRALLSLPAAKRLLCVVVLALVASQARANTIDVSLNVFYTNPANSGSGGTWQIVAKSDGSGLASLKVLLTNIATGVQDSPRGTVNGGAPAGFLSVFENIPHVGYNEITLGQEPFLPSDLTGAQSQGVFYGVGTIPNGTPTTIGPTYNNLAALQGVPWATGDALLDSAWNTAAKLASGTFAAGVTPGFYSSGSLVSKGNTFTSVGTRTIVGTISAQSIASTIVRTNFVSNGDYNLNGVVDAADYVVWQNSFGQSGVALPADGSGNGTIDAADYDYWRARFGNVIPASGAASGSSLSAVPEPASAVLLLCGLTLVLGRTLRRPFSRVACGALSPVKFPQKVRLNAPGAEKRTGLSGCFFPVFTSFSESNEKSDIRGRNCLTAPKMASIMPEGSAAIRLCCLR